MTYLSKLTKRLALAWLPALILALAPSCSTVDQAPTNPESSRVSRLITPQTAASVSISPSSASGSLGQSAQFTATAYNANGVVITGQTVVWRATDTTIVRINSSGYATAIGVGADTIVATVGAVTARAPVTVSGTVTAPSGVTDLSVSAINDTSATLSFTQVSNGSGGAASYQIRDGGAPFSWGSGTPVASGSCMSPTVTTVGARLTCTVLGLSALTAYNFQLVSYRGALGTTAVFGPLSSVLAASTTAPAAAAVASVIVSPGSASGSVGQSAQFSATAFDAKGNSLPGLTFVWTTSNAAVATVSSAGVGTATGPGTATLVATTSGKSGSAAIAVTGSVTVPVQNPTQSPPAVAGSEPTFLSTNTNIWSDTYDGLLSDVTMLANYILMNGESGVHLDLTGGMGGSAALRVDWTGTSSCQDEDHLVERDFTPSTEMYVTYNVRYTAGFLFDWSKSSGCTGNAKKLMLFPAQGGGRMNLISENHHIVLYDDNIGYATGLQNNGAEFTPEMLGDGNWHRITLHFKASSSPTSNDGFKFGWIDGKLQWNFPNINTTNSSGYYVMQVPTVLNKGAPQRQSEWMDNLRLWRP